MIFETMSKKELASKMKISYSTLSRHIKELDPEFKQQIWGRALFANEVQYIHEQITGSKKWNPDPK